MTIHNQNHNKLEKNLVKNNLAKSKTKPNYGQN